MTELLFVRMLIGHLVGDYLLQTQWQAGKKGLYSFEGWAASLVHGLSYTFAVVAFCDVWSPLFALLVFLTHWPIDKFGVSKVVFEWSGNGPRVFMPIQDEGMKLMLAGIQGLVYVAKDNTMHLALLFFLARWWCGGAP